jgi:alpha-beta hydrolase superfamily lysophospholipase
MAREPATKALLLICILLLLQSCSESPVEVWHTTDLESEFAAENADEVLTLADYLQLETRLFAELDSRVYAEVDTGDANALIRFSRGSLSDPSQFEPNWNRSFLLETDKPSGGVLLLHGMSDSPYSLRALALALNNAGLLVLGIRLPGHGTIPAGIKDLRVEDLVAVTELAAKDMQHRLDGLPLHIVGYSTGATLATHYALEAAADEELQVPASLVLISPAIRVHPVAALARVNDALANLPGLGSLAWLDVMPEFDPYKYNSFPSNAGDVVYRITRTVARKLQERIASNPASILPPTLVLKSTVDATVTTTAVIDQLLIRLKPNRHELVLFDINRAAAYGVLLTDNPGPLNERLLADDKLPFSIRFIGNRTIDDLNVVMRYKTPFSAAPTITESMDLRWPPNVISLSHVAIPFSPDDPLYGKQRPNNSEAIYLGELALRGERGLSKIPAEWVMRMRYNPFYTVVENRTLEWIRLASASSD